EFEGIDVSGVSATSSDSDADTLDGGTGDDHIFLEAGDSGIGGTGLDTFYLDGDATPTATATIADYDAADDTIIVQHTGATAPVVTVDTTGADAIISLDGTAVGTVTGNTTLTAADITLVEL
ncbi:MAG: hypothetical protein ABJQ89_19720, partial [Planktotalea sp.]